MFIKIYFDNKPLFLCDAMDPVITEYSHHDDAVFIDELNTHTVKTMIHEMQVPKVHAGIFLHPDLEELKKAFWKKFTLVPAAGGLVQNDKKQTLLIYRRGHWDLPKGKLDEGESLSECAVREVEEETGLSRIELKKFITTTFHTYHEGTKFILKESHWYRMKVSGAQPLTPQTEEDITDIKWLTTKELPAYLPACYPSVRDVLETILKK